MAYTYSETFDSKPAEIETPTRLLRPYRSVSPNSIPLVFVHREQPPERTKPYHINMGTKFTLQCYSIQPIYLNTQLVYTQIKICIVWTTFCRFRLDFMCLRNKFVCSSFFNSKMPQNYFKEVLCAINEAFYSEFYMETCLLDKYDTSWDVSDDS